MKEGKPTPLRPEDGAAQLVYNTIKFRAEAFRLSKQKD